MKTDSRVTRKITAKRGVSKSMRALGYVQHGQLMREIARGFDAFWAKRGGQPLCRRERLEFEQGRAKA